MRRRLGPEALLRSEDNSYWQGRLLNQYRSGMVSAGFPLILTLSICAATLVDLREVFYERDAMEKVRE